MSKPRQRRPMAISETAVRTARARGRKPTPLLGFDPHVPPKGVLPDGASPTKPLALDWAANQFGSAGYSAFEEGQTFLGYAYLAQLAQRPEYRVIAEAIADEMVRKWIKVEATGDKSKDDVVKAIEAEMVRLNVREAFKAAMIHDALYGMGHIYIQVGDSPGDAELATPIGNGSDSASRYKIKKGSLKALRNVEPVWTYPADYNTSDPLSPDWYRPASWYVMGRKIDATRLFTIVGREVSDILKPAYNFGGLSMSQMAKPYVDNWLETRQNINQAIRVFSTSVLKTNMVDALSGGEDGNLQRRVELFAAYRDANGVLTIDKESEEFSEVAKPLSTLDALQAQSQEHMAAVCRIPLVKLLGIQPSGLNASAEGEIRVWEDNILAWQEANFRGPLTKLVAMIQRNLGCEVDPAITFSFVPLHEMTLKERAEIRKLRVETNQILVDSGAVSPEEIRTVEVNDPESPFAGLDGRVDDLGDDPDRVVQEALKLIAADAGEWNESDHPSAENGQFGSGGGSAGGGFTEKHKAAIKHYTGAGYRQVNGHLIGGQAASSEVQEAISGLDDFLGQASLAAPETVYRGAGSLQVKDILAQAGGKIAKGKKITFNGFLSTSRDAGVARQFAGQSSSGIFMEIHLPKGAKAVDISQHSDTGAGEKETLVARNSTFKVVSFDSKSKKLVLEMVPVSNKLKQDAAPQVVHDSGGAPKVCKIADDDNRFYANHTGGVEVSGPDDGEVLLTWEGLFGEPYPGAK